MSFFLDATSILLKLVPLILLQYTVVELLLSRYIAKAKEKGIIGIDVHKRDKPRVAEMGGIILLFGYTLGLSLSSILFPRIAPHFLALACVGVIAGVIGLMDDVITLGGKEKPLLLLLSALPILTSSAFSPRLELPFIGSTRLTIIYPLSLFILITVGANAINLIDVLNGVMPGISIIVISSMVICGLISGDVDVVYLAPPLLAPLAAYFRYNRYPAKVFGGDTGSLSTGAIMTALAILGKVEFEYLVALIPVVMNGFYIVSTAGLSEHRKVKRPTLLTEGGEISISREEGIPITLVGLIVGSKPLKEQEVVKTIFLLMAFSSCLAILTSLLIPV